MKRNTFLSNSLPKILIICIFIAFIFLLFHYANVLPVRLDESLYLYKGYLFTNGTYEPFEPFGPQTNKNPLGFLIPGFFQQVFGPGIRTGRYTAIAMGLLTAVGIALICKRLTNNYWLVLLGLFAFIANTMYLTISARFLSQNLVSFLLTWMLFFALGEDRSTLEVILASILAVLVVQVRQNMLPVIPFLVIYQFWENGKKKGWTSFFTSLILFSFTTWLYWPDILRNYFSVIPDSLSPIFESFIFLPNYTEASAASHSVRLIQRYISFFRGFQNNLASIIGGLLSIPFLMQKGEKKNSKAISFLALNFFLLLFAHAWASLFNDYCVFCFPIYFSFFSILGILLLPLVIDAQMEHGSSGSWYLSLVVIVLSTFIFLGNFEIHEFPLMSIIVPRVNGLSVSSGILTLWEWLEIKFQFDYTTSELLVRSISGIGFGFIVLFIAYLLSKKILKSGHFSRILTITFVLIGSIFVYSTTWVDHKETYFDCYSGLLEKYEKTGNEINTIIGSASKVWWWGISDQILLSYLDEIEIFPAQLNYMFNFIEDEDSVTLNRYGLWNRELALDWLQETDYAIIQNVEFKGDVIHWIGQSDLVELARTDSMNQCNSEDYFIIFRRD